MKQKLFSILALLLMAATGAMAQTETLLTTITATGDKQASYSMANVATVSFSCTQNGNLSYLANWGWWGYNMTLTVTAAEGYTITKCVFYDDANRTATDSEAPFVVETIGEQDKTPRINGTPIDGGNMQSKGIKKIEVYGYVTPTATGYSVTLKDGTEDAENWKAKVGNGELQALPLTGLNGGETVTVTYSGSKRVKSVTAVKKANNPYANAKLGDLFYSDGTFSSTLVAGKTPIGVIAYLDQEGTDDDEICEKSNGAGHGLVLCLKDAASAIAWSTEISAFEFDEDAKVADVNALKRTTNVSGYTNTKTLAEKTDAATKYKAAYAAKSYTGLTAPTGTTGWFLPSAQQWVKMQTGLGALEESSITWNISFDNNHEGADKWEAALSKAGSGKYDSMTSVNLWYWSSSEYSAGNAVNLNVCTMSTGYGCGFSWYYNGKGEGGTNSNFRVRPVLAF